MIWEYEEIKINKETMEKRKKHHLDIVVGISTSVSISD